MIDDFYCIYNNMKAYLHYVKDIRFSSKNKLLLRNKSFKSIHLGKRCFILGNGPSLKTEKLSCLHDEFVFTVNQAARLPDFNLLKSNYHFWADPNFFKINKNNPEDIELLEAMLSVGKHNPELQCFFPIEQLDFITKYGIDKQLNVNYFYSALNMYNNYNHLINYSKPVLAFGTVVQWCITMAIFMGFQEIYLLGCDNTGIITTLKSILHQNDDNDYSYSVSKNEKLRMEKMLENSSLEAYLQSYIRTVQDYRRLMQYCYKRQIKLVNCSSETVIDSLPRKKLSEVLNMKK